MVTRSEQVAANLEAHGVGRGDCVVVMLGNQVELWESMLTTRCSMTRSPTFGLDTTGATPATLSTSGSPIPDRSRSSRPDCPVLTPEFPAVPTHSHHLTCPNPATAEGARSTYTRSEEHT